MKKIFFYMAFALFIAGCVKESQPGECTQPAKPTADKTEITIAKGKSAALQATGAKDAEFYWTGPGNFKSESDRIIIEDAGLQNSGPYWVKQRVPGTPCISDSVQVNVIVTGDDNCSLTDGEMQIGGHFFTSTADTSTDAGYFNVTCYDTYTKLWFTFKEKPVKDRIYTFVYTNKPADGEVWFHTNNSSETAYVGGQQLHCTVNNGKVRLLACRLQEGNGNIFSANIVY